MAIDFIDPHVSAGGGHSGSESRNAQSAIDIPRIAIADLGHTLEEVSVAYRATLPDTRGFLVLTEVTADERDETVIGGVDKRLWDCMARYRNPDHPDAREEKDTGEWEESFSTTGGRVTRTHAKSQVYYDDDSGVAKVDNSLAIEWDGQRANGTEVTIPQFRWSETHYIPDAIVTEVWKENIARATGAVNNQVFRGKQPGEVLFLGIEGSKRGRGDWPFTFYFDASQNIVDFKGGIKFRKDGQQHLWIQDRMDVEGGRLAPVPDRVYIADVSEQEPTDFNAFVPPKV